MQVSHGAAKIVVIIDDDAMVLDGMRGLLQGWGYRVVAGLSESAALNGLAEIGQQPDLIICDYALSEGVNGIEVIERIRDMFEIPALLITGAAATERLQIARASRYQLLHKPLDPTSLRALLDEILKDKTTARPSC